MFAASGDGETYSGTPREEDTFAERLIALLDQIRATDQTMDEIRAAKITKIKKALVDGSYNVSAAEVAQKIIDQMDEP